MSTTELPVSATFTRVCIDAAFIRGLYREAKKVGYLIEKTPFFGTVKDPTNNNALVFKTVKVRPGLQAITFSRRYWTELEGVGPVKTGASIVS